jgi:dihydropteroate synthase
MIEKRHGIWYAFFVGQFRRALEERYRGFGTAVMAVLNATPDSFYDGGRYTGQMAVERVRELADTGAFVVDIGGESTRPGATAVSSKEQLERIEAAVKAAVSLTRQGAGIWVSVDTTDPRVAEAVLAWGVEVINDVSCLADPDLARVVAKGNATLLLMHARGPMSQMRGFSEYAEDGYGDVVEDVLREWSIARDTAVSSGLSRNDILFDPGIGFAKNARQSREVLRRLGEFSALETGIVVGPSRKSFLDVAELRVPERRLGATIAACLYAAEHGAMMVRVHDVEIVHQALLAYRAIQAGSPAQVTSADRQGATVISEEVSCSTAS